VPRITDKLRSDAEAITPILSSVLAREFLAATSRLAAPSTRVVYRNREKRIAVSKRVYDMMSAEDFVLVLVSTPPSHGDRVVVEEAP
jgi:hypothetical protein